LSLRFAVDTQCGLPIDQAKDHPLITKIRQKVPSTSIFGAFLKSQWLFCKQFVNSQSAMRAEKAAALKGETGSLKMVPFRRNA